MAAYTRDPAPGTLLFLLLLLILLLLHLLHSLLPFCLYDSYFVRLPRTQPRESSPDNRKTHPRTHLGAQPGTHAGTLPETNFGTQPETLPPGRTLGPTPGPIPEPTLGLTPGQPQDPPMDPPCNPLCPLSSSSSIIQEGNDINYTGSLCQGRVARYELLPSSPSLPPTLPPPHALLNSLP